MLSLKQRAHDLAILSTKIAFDSISKPATLHFINNQEDTIPKEEIHFDVFAVYQKAYNSALKALKKYRF